jgi:hypothetical protein
MAASLMPPHLESLPVADPIFINTIARGVEVEELNGEMFVLLDVLHWCGNDSTGKELRRVNLSDLAGYLAPRRVRAGVLTERAIARLESHRLLSEAFSGDDPRRQTLDVAGADHLRYVRAYFMTPGIDPLGYFFEDSILSRTQASRTLNLGRRRQLSEWKIHSDDSQPRLAETMDNAFWRS